MIIVGVWHKLHRSVGWEWNLGFNFSISPNWTPHFFWKTRLEYGAILFPSGMPTSERASERCDSDGRRRTYGGPTDVRAQGCWIRIYVMRDVRRGKTMSPKKEHQCRLPACCFQSWWQLCLNLVYSIKLLISCESSKTLDFAQLYCITKSRHKREEKRITRSHLKSPEVNWSQLNSPATITYKHDPIISMYHQEAHIDSLCRLGDATIFTRIRNSIFCWCLVCESIRLQSQVMLWFRQGIHNQNNTSTYRITSSTTHCTETFVFEEQRKFRRHKWSWNESE